MIGRLLNGTFNQTNDESTILRNDLPAAACCHLLSRPKMLGYASYQHSMYVLCILDPIRFGYATAI